MHKQEDFIGSLAIDERAPYGIHTQRSLKIFPSEGLRTIGDFPAWIKAVLDIKEASAMTNKRIAKLDSLKAQAIIKSCQSLKDRFIPADYPCHFLSGGGCTSIHMNINEVIAKKAEKIEKYEGKIYSYIDPLEHVNLNQSTNDVMVTASNLAVLYEFESFDKKIKNLLEQILISNKKYGDTPFLARTCLQDAVSSKFSDLCGGWLALLKRRMSKIKDNIAPLLHINLGGTMVGKIEDIPSDYHQHILFFLKQTTDIKDLVLTDNYFDMAQNPDSIVDFFSSIDLLARSLVKVCKDIRLLCSGPEGGFAEISIPAVICGSSALPTKINPVVPEFVIQSSFKVMGNYHSAQLALEHGELNLNVWESLILTNLLEALKLMEHSVDSLAKYCFADLKLNKDLCKQHAQSLSTYLMDAKKILGYQKVVSIVKKCCGNQARLKEELKQNLKAKENT